MITREQMEKSPRKQITVAQKEHYLRYQESYYRKNKDKILARQRLNFKKNRKRYKQLLEIDKTSEGKARKKLRNKVAKEKMVKPKTCSACGSEGIIHGHHKDYNKPFDVVWLCSMCHSMLHKQLRRAV